MPTAADRELGSTLRALREDAGLSLGVMARRVHFSTSYLCNVERGKRRPTPAVVKAYREALGVTDERVLTPIRRKRDRLAARREVLGHTQESLAEVLDVAVSTVARWEQGVGRPLASLRRPLADALAVSLDELDRLLGGGDEPGNLYSWRAGETDASLGEESATRRREFIGSAAAWVAGMLAPGAAPRLAAEDIERLRAAVRELYVFGAQLGGGAVFERAVAQLHDVRRLLATASYNLATGRRLQEVAGELTEEAGWLAFDAGRQETARRFFIDALALAELADSAQLKTLVLTSMTFQAVEYGDPRESADLAEAAQRAARPVVTPKLCSTLAAREALAWARQGDSGRCGAALARSEQMLDEGEDEEDPAWMVFWVPANLHLASAEAHLSLGDPGRAEHAARDALTCAVPGYLRNESLYKAALAQALVSRGEVDEAVAVTTDALGGVGTISSERVRDRLRSVRAPLEPHTAVPGVKECVDQLARV